MLCLFFRPKYVWFPVHLWGPEIPDPSGQLAELIVYITTTRVDLYSHQILLNSAWLKSGFSFIVSVISQSGLICGLWMLYSAMGLS